mmetsp:Transcript_15849/g.23270  ORF Transcript_15849/g.23270 Transcript_15849/m.23270 type:complete len:166 (-) Transcript_15849:723-1220(-)
MCDRYIHTKVKKERADAAEILTNVENVVLQRDALVNHEQVLYRKTLEIHQQMIFHENLLAKAAADYMEAAREQLDDEGGGEDIRLHILQVKRELVDIIATKIEADNGWVAAQQAHRDFLPIECAAQAEKRRANNKVAVSNRLALEAEALEHKRLDLRSMQIVFEP